MSLLNRVVFVAWKSPATSATFPVGRLVEREEDPRFEFAYVQGAQEAAAHGFLPFVEFPDLGAVYRGSSLFPRFANRLMPDSRPEFSEFLEQLDLPSTGHDAIPILVRSGGLRRTDDLELFGFPAFEPKTRGFRYHFFVRGIRHVAGAETRASQLESGDPLFLRWDPANPADRLAVTIHAPDGPMIGWVPRCLLEDLHNLFDQGVEPAASVVRLNEPPAPIQQRLLCRLVATPGSNFRPFSTQRYMPISELATATTATPQELVA